MLKRMESFFKIFGAHLPCVLLFLLFIGFSQNISARENHVAILSSGQSPTYKNLISKVIDAVNADDSITASFDVIYLKQPFTDNNLNAILAKKDLIVTIGKRAADIALDIESEAPILSTLLPRKSFLLSASKYKNLLENSGRKITGIYLDNPPIRQILLARIILGNSKRLSILTSEPDSDYIRLVKNSASKAGIAISVEPVNPTDNIIKKLAYSLTASDALLVFPDASIFNRRTIQSILLTTYRHRTPVIAFSSGYVKAGALAAV